MPYKDPEVAREKQKTYARNYYSSDHGRKVRERCKQDARDRLRAIVDDLKCQPCTDCEQSFPPYVMDFDHVRGKKTDKLSNLVHQAASQKRLYAELAKCELVCANCHRMRHRKQRKY